MKRFDARTLVPSLILLFAIAGCGDRGKTVAMADAGRPPVAIESAKAVPIAMEQVVEVVGSLTARNEADVKTEYSGTISQVYVTQWVQVKKGTPLARLDTREADASAQAAQAATAQADVAAQRALRELERTQKLREAGLTTQQALDEAQTATEAARAAASSAKAQQTVADARRAKAIIRSPIDGVVAARSVNVGDYVENMGSPTPMFRIVDNRVLELTASVPSARMAELKVGQPLVFTSDAIPKKDFTGKVSHINPVADEVSRTVKVRAEIPNPGEILKAGLFVKGRIVTGTREGVLVVPRSALVSWDTITRSASVYVVEGGVVKRKPVETGSLSGDLVEITSGLTGGEEVVTRGGFNLRDGDRVRVVQGA